MFAFYDVALLSKLVFTEEKNICMLDHSKMFPVMNQTFEL